MSYVRTRVLPVAIISAVGALFLVAPPLLGIHAVPVPKGPPVEPRLEDWQAALDVAVEPSGVDYEALLGHRDPLLRFVQGLATHGPRTDPDAYGTQPERLAYYLNAYNALVLFGVLVHRPPASVHDVHGVIEPVPGFGFFWAQRFTLDGERVNLYDLEHDVIRELGDARIHAAINCASRSCPPLRPSPFRATNLDEQLDRATREWVGSSRGVVVEDDAISLSAIFEWYEEDFEAHARALGVGETVLDWILHYANAPLEAEIRAALEAGWPVRHRPYDWRLNRADPRPEAHRSLEE